MIWGIWHYPAICGGHGFGHGYFGEPWTGFLVFTIDTLATGTLLFYVTKKTQSVWAAAFLHAANNTFSGGTILALSYSDKHLTGIALQSPFRLFLMGIPVSILAVIVWRRMLREDHVS